MARRELRALEDGAPPPPSLDDLNPWWCMALTTEPVFLRREERSDCEMLMGLCPRGSAGVDWRVVVRRAPEIFDLMAQAAGSSSQLHLAPFEIDESPSAVFGLGAGHERLGGRCLVAMPAFENENFFDSLSMDEKAFDRRRARRRRGTGPPERWIDSYGPRDALLLWLSGFSPRQAREARFDEWSASVKSLALAMLEAGAARVEICPRFFELMPDAMDKENLALIDQGRLDPLRQRWDLESASAAAVLPAKRRAGSI